MKLNVRPAVTVSSTSKSRTTDKCCICQLDKKEDVKSPLTNPVKKGDDGYVTMARNIPRFQSLHQLPINIDPARFDEGGGIEKTLRRNKLHYYTTTQTYKKLKKDQPQQLPGMKVVEVISQERPKRKKKKSVFYVRLKEVS